MTPSQDIQRLIEIMAALRTASTGCPWDLEQTFNTIAPYTIEEAYEVADAIERGDLADLKDELGDLLLQVVYHARMAEEQGAFTFGDIVDGITRKMIRRHPHVFGDATARSAGAVKGLWDKIKAEERAEKEAATGGTLLAPGDSPAGSQPPGAVSLLADVPVALPGLTRAVKLQDKAARVGFDWPTLAPVFDKLKEELAEFEEVALPADPRSALIAASDCPAGSRPEAGAPSGLPAQAGIDEGESEAASEDSPDAADKIKEEFGDLLFVMANIARHLKIDPEAALRAANQKFTRRFAHIEQRLAAQGKTPAHSTLADMDALWDEAKAMERQN